ncbi:GNAT family N-acetyltransferase [Solimonas soli]|uniref:GNAT family N-acetyltransferase n=1 Tax=Solimonas soli TaxID=413479 RepID=UPI0004B49EC1|nr:GNAT family N-acetyltransferase [Solimonas soli]
MREHPANWSIGPLPASDTATAEAIIDLLRDHNAPYLGRPSPEPFRLALTGAGRLAGGLLGQFRSHWLHVEILVVQPALRGSGAGRALMAAAEAAARERGCHGLWLDTFDFQAPHFYEHLGFTRFGTIADFHDGHARHFYQKRF